MKYSAPTSRSSCGRVSFRPQHGAQRSLSSAAGRSLWRLSFAWSLLWHGDTFFDSLLYHFEDAFPR
ncbi:unnamed protein product, partial [Amoebophrya sp. A25]|eukprot:GSA25T00008936001.1